MALSDSNSRGIRFLSLLENLTLSRTDLDGIFHLSELYGRVAYDNQLGVYSNNRIEKHLVDKVVSEINPGERVADRDAILVVTDALETGGHTRLAERLASFHASPPDLLVTIWFSGDVRTRLDSFFQRVFSLQENGLRDKILEVVNLLSRYRKIVLLVSACDVLTIAACGIIKQAGTSQVIFVQQADHHFTFGSYVANLTLEISENGHRINLQRDIVGETSFLGIPCDVKPVKRDDLSREGGPEEKLIFSAGLNHRFKPHKGRSLTRFIFSHLRKNPLHKFVLVGPDMLSGYWWWFLKLRFWRRLKLYKSLPYDKYMEFLGSADFYLDSYPMGGGTAFVEQYSRGFPCSGLVSPVQGYSPAERLKVRSLEELSELIRKGGHDFDSQLHDDVLYVHGMEEGKKRYLGALYDGALFRNEALQRTPYSGDPSFMEKEKISTISDKVSWLFGQFKLREQLNLFLHFLLAVDYPAMFWNQGHLASQKILIRLVTGAKKSLFFVRRVLRRG